MPCPTKDGQDGSSNNLRYIRPAAPQAYAKARLPFCVAAVKMDDHQYGGVHTSAVFLCRRRMPVVLVLCMCARV